MVAPIDLVKLVEVAGVGSFFLFLLFILLIRTIIKYAFYYPVKLMIRRSNIKNNGWPPTHCDADGDFKPAKDESSE